MTNELDSCLFYCTVILFYFTCALRWCIVSKTAEDIVRLLYWPGSDIILVAWPQAPVPIGMQNTRCGKFLRF